MRKKKLFKKLLALVMALVLSNAVTTVERAEAASCPPHGEYYDEERGAIHNGYQHKVQVDYYVENEFHEDVPLTSITGVKYYEWCTVTFFDVYVSVRCKKCNIEMTHYYYRPDEGEPRHSRCAVG